MSDDDERDRTPDRAPSAAERSQALRALGGAPLLRDVPPERIEALLEQVVWHRFEDGERIIAHGALRAHGVFLVVEGTAHIYRTGAQGKRVALGTAGVGDTFGEFSVIAGRPGSASVTAAGATRVAEIPSEAFEALLDEYPAVSRSLLERIVGAVRALDERVVDLEHVEDEMGELRLQLLRAIV